MRFHNIDEPRIQQQVQTSEVLNIRLLLDILAIADEERFSQRKPWDVIADMCGVHRSTVYKTLAVAERALGVIIRIDPEEARPRVVSWGAIAPDWLKARSERVAAVA